MKLGGGISCSSADCLGGGQTLTDNGAGGGKVAASIYEYVDSHASTTALVFLYFCCLRSSLRFVSPHTTLRRYYFVHIIGYFVRFEVYNTKPQSGRHINDITNDQTNERKHVCTAVSVVQKALYRRIKIKKTLDGMNLSPLPVGPWLPLLEEVLVQQEECAAAVHILPVHRHSSREQDSYQLIGGKHQQQHTHNIKTS